MVFEHIEDLKQKLTDKYVVVDNSRAELRRFDGQTGVVKTVNMNGRALVEFDGFENIGWYDIAPEFLKVVDAPLPTEEKKPAKKPAQPAAKQAAAPEKKAAAPEKAAAPAAKKAGGGMSVAEMLAAARGEKGGAAAAKPKAPAAPKASGEAAAPKVDGAPDAKPAQAQPVPSGKLDPKKLSVAEMLAAARAEKSGGAPPATAKVESASPAATELESEPVEAATATAEATPVDAPEQPAPATPRGELPTETAEICAYCRRVDGS